MVRFSFTDGKLKASKRLLGDLQLTGDEVVEVFVPPFSFTTRIYRDSSCVRIYVPAQFHGLVPRDFWASVRRSGGNGRAYVSVTWLLGQVVLDVFDVGYLRILDKIPSSKTPRYDRGMGYCGSCGAAYPLELSRFCPICGRQLRTRSRRGTRLATACYIHLQEASP